jgi:RNA polymerase sigma-70 factor (ECF subfamily)
MDEPDPRTVKAAAAGDTAAFVEIMTTTQADVWRFLRHLTGDPEVAADLTQDTFVRVHQRIGSYRFEARFSSWLLRIARNLAWDEMRSRERRDRLQVRLRVDRAGSATPGDTVELRAAVASLGDDLREAFVSVEIFGLTYREAADVLDVPEGTVKSRVFRARQALVAWLRSDESDDEKGRRRAR